LIRFKQQEEFLIKKIEELTQFSQTELLENQEKLAKYNEKCRFELNELRNQYNNEQDLYYSSNDATRIASNNNSFIENNNKFVKNQKYSTYSPQNDESSSPHNYNNRQQQSSSKSKTWPEKEHKLINNKHNDDIVLDLPSTNKSTIHNNFRKYSHAESFESSQTNAAVAASNEDSYSLSLNAQTRGKMFEVRKLFFLKIFKNSYIS
jgi:hypothetical protein